MLTPSSCAACGGTALVGATVAFELLCLLTEARVARERRDG